MPSPHAHMMHSLLSLSGSVTAGAGAIGRVAADKYEPLTYRSNMNLQFGMVAARPDDCFLMASDGLWDTLDPVQVRQPQGSRPIVPPRTFTPTPSLMRGTRDVSEASNVFRR